MSALERRVSLTNVAIRLAHVNEIVINVPAKLNLEIIRNVCVCVSVWTHL